MGILREVTDRVYGVDASALGKGAITLSGGGTAVQWITDFGSVTLVVLNVILAIGGIYLLFLKIHQQRMSGKSQKRDN